jgi:hypothetical protein
MYARGVHIRFGEVTQIAGLAGSQKSGLAEWMVAQWNLPTLYISPDLAAHQAMSRLAALATGDKVSSVKAAMEAGAASYYSESLEQYNIQWCFDTNPTLTEIGQELNAYIEAWDRYPSVVVIDNLTNIEADHDDQWAGMKYLLTEFQSFARVMGSAVIVLHHMSEGGSRDTTMPAPRRDLMGKRAEIPEVILSVALDPGTGQ